MGLLLGQSKLATLFILTACPFHAGEAKLLISDGSRPSKRFANIVIPKKVKFVSVQLTVLRNICPAKVSTMVNPPVFLPKTNESAMVKFDLGNWCGKEDSTGTRGVLRPTVAFDGFDDLNVEEEILVAMKPAAKAVTTKRTRMHNRVQRLR
jgi:hypothetical protein